MCLAGEDKKNSLEGVFGCSPVPYHVAANTQHHGPVSMHQYGKRSLRSGITAAHLEPGQQLSVG
jgi:hypothetical protein